MADPRRAGPLASLSVLGAGAGWGALTGTAAGGLSVVVSADDPGLADLPGALGLALLFGAPAGAALGLALALLPAVTVACVRSTRRARVVAAGACAPGAVLVVVAQFNDGVDGQEAEALVFATAALFGVWRCQRSAAVAVERVARWRAAPRVPPPGIPLEEPSRQPGAPDASEALSRCAGAPEALPRCAGETGPMERTSERHGDDYDARLTAAGDVQHGEGREAEHSAEHDARHGDLSTGHGPIDLAPAADRLMRLIPRVEDERLDDPTPCEGRTVRELLGHLLGLTLAFRAAADKDFGPLTDTSPDGDGWPQATGDWRERLAEQLPALVTAWYPEEAWRGSTRAGGVDLPGEAAGVVALGELVLHGWDLSRALGQPYECDEESARLLGIYVEGFDPAGTPGMFGPAVEAPADAEPFDAVLARTGRNPAWETAPAGQAS